MTGFEYTFFPLSIWNYSCICVFFPTQQWSFKTFLISVSVVLYHTCTIWPNFTLGSLEQKFVHSKHVSNAYSSSLFVCWRLQLSFGGWSDHTLGCKCAVKYYSATKNESLNHVAIWVNLKGFTDRKKSVSKGCISKIAYLLIVIVTKIYHTKVVFILKLQHVKNHSFIKLVVMVNTNCELGRL